MLQWTSDSQAGRFGITLRSSMFSTKTNAGVVESNNGPFGAQLKQLATRLIGLLIVRDPPAFQVKPSQTPWIVFAAPILQALQQQCSFAPLANDLQIHI